MELPDPEIRRLARLDSPARIRWLREHIRGYTTDLGARSYFRLQTVVAGIGLDDPKSEAIDCCLRIASQYGLTAAESGTAFKAEWDEAMRIAVQVGEKLKIAGLSHIKITGSAHGVETALQAAVAKFPRNWPHLTPDDLNAIAAGFQRPARSRRAA